MKYGKIVNGVIEYAPNYMEKNGAYIFGYNLPENSKMMLADGYKPVELIEDKSKYSDCEGEYTFEFIDKGNKIVEVAKFKKYPDDVLSEKIREKRNQILLNTDKFMIQDYPISEKEREKIKLYRQYLRDIPSNKDFPSIKVLNFDEWNKE